MHQATLYQHGRLNILHIGHYFQSMENNVKQKIIICSVSYQ